MKKIIPFIGFLLCWQTGFCQPAAGENSKSDASGMLALNLGMPFPEMKKAIRNNMGDAGFGLSLLYVSNPLSWGKNKRAFPVQVGGELGYTYYGRFKTDAYINGYNGDYKTSYGIAKLNAVVRFRPAYASGFTPFADVYAGGNFYLSRIKENLDFIESALGLQPVEFGGTASAAFVKGIAVGFSAGSRQADKARFVCRFSYTDGSSFRYIVRNSLLYDPAYNRLTYQEGRAPLRYFMIELGIGI